MRSRVLLYTLACVACACAFACHTDRTQINFTVTRSGLEGQLLGVTLQHERPELEAQKSKYLAQEEEFRVQLAGLESELLATLAASQGDLLENQVQFQQAVTCLFICNHSIEGKNPDSP